jgi:hypothetical protein
MQQERETYPFWQLLQSLCHVESFLDEVAAFMLTYSL